MMVGVSLPTPLAWISVKKEEISKGGAQSNLTLLETQILTVWDQEQQGLEGKLGQALEGRRGVWGRRCVLSGFSRLC